LNYTDIITLIKKTDRHIYLVHGDNAYQKKQALTAIMQKFGVAKSALDFEQLSEASSSQDIISACNTVSFLGSTRVICISNFSGLKATKATANALDIDDYLSELPPSSCLIFICDQKADKRKKLYKAIKKLGVDIELNQLDTAALLLWIIEAFSKENKTISRQNANKLIEICGNDMMMLENEIEKIVCYSDKKIVDAIDIETVASKSLEYNVFKIHELFIKKDLNAGLSLLNEVIEKEKSPFGVMGLLASKLRTLYKAKTLVDAGVSGDRAIKYIGGHPFAAKIALSECKNFTATHLREAINLLASLDYKLKSGNAMMDTTIEDAFLKIYNL
jgi:DNA polymerase III subunit delta